MKFDLNIFERNRRLSNLEKIATRIHHKQKINLNPNTFAIASGGFFVAMGLTYRF